MDTADGLTYETEKRCCCSWYINFNKYSLFRFLIDNIENILLNTAPKTYNFFQGLWTFFCTLILVCFRVMKETWQGEDSNLIKRTRNNSMFWIHIQNYSKTLRFVFFFYGPSLPTQMILQYIYRYPLLIVLLSTENIKSLLGVIQWVRTKGPNKEFAILARNTVTIPFTRKLYRKGSAYCSCYCTAFCKTVHWTAACNVTYIDLLKVRHLLTLLINNTTKNSLSWETNIPLTSPE